jgi:hypothetical protein
MRWNSIKRISRSSSDIRESIISMRLAMKISSFSRLSSRHMYV